MGRRGGLAGGCGHAGSPGHGPPCLPGSQRPHRHPPSPAGAGSRPEMPSHDRTPHRATEVAGSGGRWTGCRTGDRSMQGSRGVRLAVTRRQTTCIACARAAPRRERQDVGAQAMPDLENVLVSGLGCGTTANADGPDVPARASCQRIVRRCGRTFGTRAWSRWMSFRAARLADHGSTGGGHSTSGGSTRKIAQKSRLSTGRGGLTPRTPGDRHRPRVLPARTGDRAQRVNRRSASRTSCSSAACAPSPSTASRTARCATWLVYPSVVNVATASS